MCEIKCDDGITIISQTTAERKQEAKDLFEKIKPYLDQGMIYSTAICIVTGVNYNVMRNRAWYRDLVEYGESQGYLFEDYSGKSGGKKKVQTV